MAADETVYEEVPSGVRGWLQRRRGFVAAVVSALALWGLSAAFGDHEIAAASRAELARILAEQLVAELHSAEANAGGPPTQIASLPAPSPPDPQPVIEIAAAPPPVQSDNVGDDPVIASLQTQIATANDALLDARSELTRVRADLAQASRRNDSLSAALAQAEDERDSAVNQAVNSATAEVRQSYEDLQCFTRSDWNDYRTNLGRLCSGAGD